MLESLKALVPLLIAIIGASLTFLYNQKLDRRRRTEQYQLEQIETILKGLTALGFTAVGTPGDAELRQARLDLRTALALLPLYGNPEVLKHAKVLLEAPVGQDRLVYAQGKDMRALTHALQAQGRDLLHGGSSVNWITRAWRHPRFEPARGRLASIQNRLLSRGHGNPEQSDPEGK